MMRSILAFDPGGTKCHALLLREDGRILGWGTGQAPGLSGRSEKAFLLSAREALGPRPPDSLFMISIIRPPPKAIYQLATQIEGSLCVSEHESAFALAETSSGLVVLAGTGSFVYGKTRDGRALGLDGLGPVLGDTGSAYHIGLLAIRAAAKSDWHPRFYTILQQRLYQFYGLNTLHDLIQFSLKPKDRSIIAAFARIVDTEANAGDLVAIRIIKEASEGIADILSAVVERLEMTREPYRMIGVGSVINHSSIYWNHLCEKAKTVAPLLEPQRSPYPAVLGVALAGLRRLHGQDDDRVAAVLFASYQSFKTERFHDGPITVS